MIIEQAGAKSPRPQPGNTLGLVNEADPVSQATSTSRFGDGLRANRNRCRGRCRFAAKPTALGTHWKLAEAIDPRPRCSQSHSAS